MHAFRTASVILGAFRLRFRCMQLSLAAFREQFGEAGKGCKEAICACSSI